MPWLDTLVEFAQSNLGNREREALWTRGVSDEQIDQYAIGYLNVELPQSDVTKDFLEWCWKGRRLDDVFVFPLTNTLGQVKGFQFRHVERERTGYMDYIPYEDELALFGLSQAMPHVWGSQSVFTVEGVYDLFPVQRVRPDVIATLTARISQQLVRVLRRLVDDVWLGYDMDDTGRKGCADFVKYQGQKFRTNVVAWPRVPKLDGKGLAKDPNEVWETWGDRRFGVFIKQLRDPHYTEES